MNLVWSYAQLWKPAILMIAIDNIRMARETVLIGLFWMFPTFCGWWSECLWNFSMLANRLAASQRNPPRQRAEFTTSMIRLVFSERTAVSCHADVFSSGLVCLWPAFTVTRLAGQNCDNSIQLINYRLRGSGTDKKHAALNEIRNLHPIPVKDLHTHFLKLFQEIPLLHSLWTNSCPCRGSQSWFQMAL